jgi:hypothetical protein
MKKARSPPQDERSTTEDQMDLTRKLVLASSRAPLLPTGTITACQVCGGDMVTTNNLRKAIPVPMGLIILAGLPGAQCTRCKSVAYDAGALAAILENSASEIVADYETRVTRASGSTLGTYFRADLSRVLRLSGKERLRWKVLDKDRAFVEVER